MSKRIDPSWSVLASVEDSDGSRCVDFFSRPDGTFGFEEFRRDPEDCGQWTPLRYLSDGVYSSEAGARAAARQAASWFAGSRDA
jgi:hypothetical protein